MEGGAASIMDTIIAAASKVIEFSGTCLNAMIGNEVYAFVFAAGFVGIGLALVRKMKHTAR